MQDVWLSTAQVSARQAVACKAKAEEHWKRFTASWSRSRRTYHGAMWQHFSELAAANEAHAKDPSPENLFKIDAKLTEIEDFLMRERRKIFSTTPLDEVGDLVMGCFNWLKYRVGLLVGKRR